MFGRYLNHTKWDGVNFPIIAGLFSANFTFDDDVTGSPAVVDGWVYIGSSDNYVAQFNATNISQIPNSYFETNDSIVSSPAVVNGYVYVGSFDGSLYQLNASDLSQEIAHYRPTSAILSSPAVANGYVYVGGYNGKVYQFNASDISQLIATYQTGTIVFSSPAVSDGYVYVGSYDHKLYQLNASNISQLIASYTTGGEIFSSPAVANGYVYFGSYDDNIYQLNATNVSQLIARYTTANNVESSPAVANGFVYIANNGHTLFQLNASNISQLINIYDNFGETWNVRSSPTIANGYVYIGGEDGSLYQFDAANITHRTGTFQTNGAIVYSTPAVANGYVYFGSTDNNLYQVNASNITPPCIPEWDCIDGTCLINDTMICSGVIDLNDCGLNYTGNYSEFGSISCDYCTPLWSVTSDCLENNTEFREYEDENDCYAVTSLYSDSCYYEFDDCDSWISCSFLGVDFECGYDENPLIEIIGNRIFWYCSFANTSQDYNCISYVKEAGYTIQTNPQQKTFSSGLWGREQESREFFTAPNGLVNPYFTTDNLKHNTTYLFGVECSSEQGRFTSEHYVTPMYQNLDEVAYRSVWVKNNVGYLLGGAIVLIIIIVLIAWVVR
jgi:outer membrane protein assembly factor BamB